MYDQQPVNSLVKREHDVHSTGVMDVIALEVRRALVKRVADSQSFTSAPRLRAFFLYVVDCSLRGLPEEATEQQIGIHVFSRPAGYNSGDDSIVRSQARLLRMKLDAYFSSDGKNEPIVIEIPKGHYVPVFQVRISHPSPTELLAPSVLLESSGSYPTKAGNAQLSTGPVTSSILGSAVAFPLGRVPISVRQFVLLLAIFALGPIAGLWSYQRLLTTEAHRPTLLWSPFFTKTPPTLVIYSNPLFHGTPLTGLKLVTPGLPLIDHSLDDETYTGTGEVAAIRQLTRFFDAHNADFVLKRSRLVTWDEARSSNLIFVGAPSQNSTLDDLPALSQFVIVVDQDEHGSIVNLHPLPGEPSSFPTNDKTQETAIVALIPGLEAKTHIMVVSGLTTIGTETAVEYLCRTENISVLAQQAGTINGEIRPFEAILHVGVSKGVGVNSKLLLLHHR